MSDILIIFHFNTILNMTDIFYKFWRLTSLHKNRRWGRRGGRSVLVTRDFVFTVAMGGWQAKILYLRPRYRIVKTNV